MYSEESNEQKNFRGSSTDCLWVILEGVEILHHYSKVIGPRGGGGVIFFCDNHGVQLLWVFRHLVQIPENRTTLIQGWRNRSGWSGFTFRRSSNQYSMHASFAHVKECTVGFLIIRTKLINYNLIKARKLPNILRNWECMNRGFVRSDQKKDTCKSEGRSTTLYWHLLGLR